MGKKIVTINELVLQLQKQGDAIGGDAPVVIAVPDEEYGGDILDYPSLEVKDLRMKGRSSPAYATRRTRLHSRKGVVLS